VPYDFVGHKIFQKFVLTIENNTRRVATVFTESGGWKGESMGKGKSRVAGLSGTRPEPSLIILWAGFNSLSRKSTLSLRIIESGRRGKAVCAGSFDRDVKKKIDNFPPVLDWLFSTITAMEQASRVVT
jgi:hypothetical protein